MTNLAIRSLRLGMITLAATGALILTGCQNSGKVGQESTYDVAKASPDDIEAALKRDGKVTLTGGVVFETNSASLSAAGRERTEQLANALKKNPELRVAVVGYTDDTGPFQYNLDLSKQRAEAMVNALIKDFGINQTRLAAVGVGPLAPVASNSTPEGRAQNRRVEVVLIK